MRIAYFTESLPPQNDEVAITCARVARFADQAGVDCRFFIPTSVPELPWHHRIVEIKNFPLSCYPDQALAQLLQQETYRKLDHFRPQLLHLFNPDTFSLLGLNYARERKLPLVISLHDHLASFSPAAFPEENGVTSGSYLHWLHECSQAFLITSVEEAMQLESCGFTKVRFWPQGVDSRWSAENSALDFAPQTEADRAFTQLLECYRKLIPAAAMMPAKKYQPARAPLTAQRPLASLAAA